MCFLKIETESHTFGSSLITLRIKRIMNLLIILGIIIILAIIIASLYNSLVKLRNNRENAFADIDVQLKQRHDLIPQLVDTVSS